MKKYYIILLLLSFLSLNLSAQSNSLELGKRYIKLGGSFRESGQFEMSKTYLDKGLSLVTKYNNKYWIAVGKEYMGYYWRDRAVMEDRDEYFTRALEYFDQALNIYKNVLKVNPSSIKALQNVILTIRTGPRADIINQEPGGKTGDQDLFVGDNAETQYIDAALEALYKHDFKRAEKLLKKALKANPDSEFAKYLLYIMPKIEQYPSPGLNYEKIKIITSKKELKSEFIKHDEVDIIDLSNSDGVTRIPREIGDFKNVKIVNLSNNDISKISEDDELCALKHLKILDLSYNNLMEIPECIKFMPKLQVLYLRGNDIPFAEILRLKDKNPYLQIVMDEEE